MNSQKRELYIGQRRAAEAEGLGEMLCARCDRLAARFSCYCVACEDAINAQEQAELTGKLYQER